MVLHGLFLFNICIATIVLNKVSGGVYLFPSQQLIYSLLFLLVAYPPKTRELSQLYFTNDCVKKWDSYFFLGIKCEMNLVVLEFELDHSITFFNTLLFWGICGYISREITTVVIIIIIIILESIFQH